MNMVKLNLLAEWTHRGKTYKPGDLEYIEVDPTTASELKEKGIAEDWKPEPNFGWPSSAPSDDAAAQHARNQQLIDTVDSAVAKALEPIRKRIPDVTVVKDNVLDDPKFGFKSIGEQALAVRAACNKSNPQVDVRLTRVQKAAATTFARDQIGADGGFLVMPDFVNTVMTFMNAETSLLSRCNRIPIAGNMAEIPASEELPWGNTTGAICKWTEEGVAATQSKPILKLKTLRLRKLVALTPVTEELLSDAPLLTGFLTTLVGNKMSFEVDDTIVNGKGSYQPLGILNSGCLVSTTRTGGGNAIDAADVVNVYARMPSDGHANAVWLCNNDVLPSIHQLAISNTVVAFYSPPQGLSSAPAGTLMGRPIIVTQHCANAGTVGDLIYADLSKYLVITKQNEMTASTSMHLFFDADTVAFKFVTRIDGQPWYDSVIAPRAGSSNLSYFVTVAT